MGLALGPLHRAPMASPPSKLGEDEIPSWASVSTANPDTAGAPSESTDALIAELYERVRGGPRLTEGRGVVALVNGMGAPPSPSSTSASRARRSAEEGRHRDRPPDGRQLRLSLECPASPADLMRARTTAAQALRRTVGYSRLEM